MLQVILFVNPYLLGMVTHPPPALKGGSESPSDGRSHVFPGGSISWAGAMARRYSLTLGSIVKGPSIRGIPYGSLDLSLGLILDNALALRVLV